MSLDCRILVIHWPDLNEPFAPQVESILGLNRDRILFDAMQQLPFREVGPYIVTIRGERISSDDYDKPLRVVDVSELVELSIYLEQRNAPTYSYLLTMFAADPNAAVVLYWY